ALMLNLAMRQCSPSRIVSFLGSGRPRTKLDYIYKSIVSNTTSLAARGILPNILMKSNQFLQSKIKAVSDFLLKKISEPAPKPHDDPLYGKSGILSRRRFLCRIFFGT